MSKRKSADPSVDDKVLSRRKLLKVSAAASATLVAQACTPAGNVEPIPEMPKPPGAAPDDGAVALDLDVLGLAFDSARFDLSVQSGDAKADSVVVWAHTTADTAMRLVVWRDDGDDRLAVFDDDVEPDAAGNLRVTLDGLAAGTEYLFAFIDGDVRSRVGRFVTAYDDDTMWHLTVACGTCSNFRNQPYFTLEATPDVEPYDLFVHLGDMSYNDGAFTPEEYRAKWHQTLGDPGYQAALAQSSLLMAWDDHEFTNNLDPETVSPELFANARDSFFEHLPLAPGDNGRLWRSHRWGQTAEFFTLDCRTERAPSTREENGQYMSPAQMEWFKTSLKDSPAVFKVVLNSVPITWMPEELWALKADRWQGYLQQREEILNFIVDENIENVLFLSGDFHCGFVAKVEAEGPRSSMYEIAVGPSANANNPLGLLVELDPQEYKEAVFPENQFLYGRAKNAATYLSFNPFRKEVRVRFYDAYDDVDLFHEVLKLG